MAGNSKYITVSDDNFQREVLESRKPVLVDFWADWASTLPTLVRRQLSDHRGTHSHQCSKPLADTDPD